MAQGFVVSPQHLANNILASGTLLPSEEINVQAEVSGKIIMLNFQEGVTVGKGALLAKLYDADLQAQLKKLDYSKGNCSKNGN
jgi:membrane fusion protein (multidrug efflux system)